MADFTVNMSGTVELDDSIVTEYQSEFIVAYNQSNVIDAAVEYSRDIGAKAISFPRFTQLAQAITPLNEREDINSVAMADSEIILTPQEYGNAVTTTRLAELQTGGRAARAAVSLVGQNMASTMNKLGTLALEASTNVVYGGTATSEATVAAGDVMTPALLDKIYNKMARANVPAHSATGTYVAYMHDDVIHDLRTGTTEGTWIDVSKYSGNEQILRNEIGMFKGFRIVRNNDATVNADGGVTTVDTYTSTFLGFNALGKAESAVPSMVMTGPFDKLNRFANIGWYGVLQYKIIEQDSAWKAITSSSVGANA